MGLTGGRGKSGRKPRQNGPKPVDGLAARQAALEGFVLVTGQRATIDDALEAVFAKPKFNGLADRDRGFARAMLVVSFRHFGGIEQRLRKFLKKPLPKRATHLRPILHLGLAQLDHLDVPDHAAVSLTVELARSDPVCGHFVALVNAVMRAAARDPASAPGRERTVPAWLWRRWRSDHGEMAARDIVAAHVTPPDLDLTVKSDATGWAERLGGSVLATGSIRLQCKTMVSDLPGYAEGEWWVQDAAAALPARLLGPIAGMDVLDLCAAPGGKTAQLAQSGARVTAVDIAPRRLERLRDNLERIGLDAELVAADVLDWQPDRQFDAILLDAPCSATGTIRRHPEVPYTKTEDDIAALASLQDAMLDRARAWLKPDGVMIYCTCSLERAEGEDRVAEFLAANPAFERRAITSEEIGGLDAITEAGDVRTLPFMRIEGAATAGIDGFYIARLAHAS